MKKIIALLLAGLMAVVMASCGKDRVSNLPTSSEAGSSESEALVDVSSESSSSEATIAASSKPSATSDTAVAKNVLRGDGYTMKIPNGWKQQDNADVTMLVPEDYPTVADNITVVKTDKDVLFSTYTKDSFESSYKTIFENFKIDTFEKITVNGCSTIRMSYNVTMSGLTMKQEQYILDGPNCCMAVTFTAISNDLSAIAKECVQSIQFS